ncbi:AAA family ATPase [Mesorhizobium sp. B2-4-17]|uniref:AAA family ATPase n=1 Tax=Mesorhizobium sp. B2-4-17 TaxID=2589932 RepID=UPI00112E5C7D|nr:AAA family ATPase [Mesorhizobium sp. B2-4-17]TPK70794.1 hypothetical protein FJ548_29390 [Mesorhizobium sp. B2-4-17]
MIIEFFGSPGSGKTTFAHALARQLREKGYHAKVALSYKPSTRAGSFDLGIFLFVSRIVSAIFSTARILFSSGGTANLTISLSLIMLIPPDRRIWRARIWQYILRLSYYWKKAEKSPDIIIFDQGYVQTIGSLAMFNRGSDSVALAEALSLAPKADLTVRVVVPHAVVETRLRQRMENEPPAERIFEADLDVNMRSFGVFEAINGILLEFDRKVISVEILDDQSTFERIPVVEQEIISTFLRTDAGLQPKGTKDRKHATGMQPMLTIVCPRRCHSTCSHSCSKACSNQ